MLTDSCSHTINSILLLYFLLCLEEYSGLFDSLEVTSFHLVVTFTGRWQVLSNAHCSFALNSGLRRSRGRWESSLALQRTGRKVSVDASLQKCQPQPGVGWGRWSRVSVPATLHLSFQCPLLLLSSLFSSLSLSHLHSHLLSPFNSLPPIILCFSTISRPGCFFKGGPLAISLALAHILPTQEERAFSSF